MVSCQNNYFNQLPYEANYQRYIQPEMNQNEYEYREIPRRAVGQADPQFNYPANQVQPTFNSARPYHQVPSVPQYHSTYGCTRTVQPPQQVHNSNPPHPNFRPIHSMCNSFNAMSLNGHTRVPQYPQQYQREAPPAPQRRLPPQPVESNPPLQAYSNMSSFSHAPDYLYIRNEPISLIDIKGEADTIIDTPELGVKDIPMWADVPVSQLPKKTLDFICHRLDNICYCERNWEALSKLQGYSLVVMNNIRESPGHTALLLGYWKPRLHEFIHQLKAIDCKKLASEIIQDLRYAAPPIHSARISPTHSVRASSDPGFVPKPYSHNSLVKRAEYEPLCQSYTNINPTVASGAPPMCPSHISPSSSLSSYSSPSEPPTTLPGPAPVDTGIDAEIFVSYDNKDKDIGQEIVRQVRQLNYTVACEDDVIAGGSELLERTELFKKCRIIIGLISPDYIRDDFPYYEAIAGVSKSVTGMKRTFIPFHIRKTENIPEFISSRRGIQWTDDNKWNKLKRSLVRL